VKGQRWEIPTTTGLRITVDVLEDGMAPELAACGLVQGLVATGIVRPGWKPEPMVTDPVNKVGR
jgi:hypothetical protein